MGMNRVTFNYVSLFALVLSIGVSSVQADNLCKSAPLKAPQSGTWNGIYSYPDGRVISQHMDVKFVGSNFSGTGADTEVGQFTVSGNYEPSSNHLMFIKVYLTRNVKYEGQFTDGYLRGNWKFDNLVGAFDLGGDCMPAVSDTTAGTGAPTGSAPITSTSGPSQVSTIPTTYTFSTTTLPPQQKTAPATSSGTWRQ